LSVAQMAALLGTPEVRLIGEQLLVDQPGFTIGSNTAEAVAAGSKLPARLLRGGIVTAVIGILIETGIEVYEAARADHTIELYLSCNRCWMRLCR